MAALGRYLPIHEITQRRSLDRGRRLRATNLCELSHSGRELRATGFWQAPVKLARVKPRFGLKRTLAFSESVPLPGGPANPFESQPRTSRGGARVSGSYLGGPWAWPLLFRRALTPVIAS